MWPSGPLSAACCEYPVNTHRYRRTLDRAQLDAVLRLSTVDSNSVREYHELTEASYNTVYRLKLADGSGLVLKVAPDPAAPGLAHEHDLIRTEAMFYRATKGRIPVPEVVYADGEYLLMTDCPGENWVGRRVAERDPLRRQLGQIVATLHQTTGTTFGYPQNPPKKTWREAFTGMIDDVLDDAERYAAPLPVNEIRQTMHRRADLLDAVHTPTLVHFDLWDGNILLDDGKITGLVDGERAFWGDPMAELASLSIFGDIEEDHAFLEGYGGIGFDADTRRRLAMYRAYLFMIMIVETVPRGYEGERHERIMSRTGKLLTAQLAKLS
jgi:aminoglycoside phosphotransferase (APT) family kinase protein